jgi:predicted nucleic acid-binding protein
LDRIFLDANVLFSAAYLENSGLARLWQLDDAELLSSAYAVEEARRNLALDRPQALARLERLTPKLTLSIRRGT